MTIWNVMFLSNGTYLLRIVVLTIEIKFLHTVNRRIAQFKLITFAAARAVGSPWPSTDRNVVRLLAVHSCWYEMAK